MVTLRGCRCVICTRLLLVYVMTEEEEDDNGTWRLLCLFVQDLVLVKRRQAWRRMVTRWITSWQCPRLLLGNTTTDDEEEEYDQSCS